MPLEEGYVYGRAPEQPSNPPDLNELFEAADIPKGKLGDLPMSVEWYAGAKERSRLRNLEMESLFEQKNALRSEWVDLALADLNEWGAIVEERKREVGPVLGLAEVLARTAHERPQDAERVERLVGKSAKAFANQARLAEALEVWGAHIEGNEEVIRLREHQDQEKEVQRVAEQKAQELRKQKADRRLARQAALLRGEDVPPSSDEEEEQAKEEEEARAAVTTETGLGFVHATAVHAHTMAGTVPVDHLPLH